ncbi:MULTISPECIES: globin-coupled sensor protein [Anoxybacillus]|uniref:Heme-based aerotactic transducer hemAT n=1 Tax=Anoxybacillus ayderensis TaxID=265546 RepID=A0A0D0HX83_9BACL|nr:MULTISPECIES: globin-coupled sensor protein [Anoxybacillus]EPZ37637.1 methyl-accepting chemotaxis protein [Anoxybacillus ayderensis]KIP22328.1 Heme-based aerotactic transducer hemAT [Anoxybacillus ayderensis]NNU95321.1 globin-coupled sensor protein [Anoxybacillus sp. EFIL]
MFKRKQEERDLQLEAILQMKEEPIRLHEGTVERQLALIGMTTKDIAILQHVKPYIEANIARIVDAFYGALQKESHLLSIIQQHSTIERLKQTLTTHVKEMFNGNIDEAFIEKRRRVAQAHVRIGLEPKWYIASFQHLLEEILAVMLEQLRQPSYVIVVMKSVSKMLNVEQQLVLEQYERENEELRLQMETLKQQMKEQVKASIQQLSHASDEVSASVAALNAQTAGILQAAQEASHVAVASAEKSAKGKQQLQAQVENMLQMNEKMKQIEANMGKLQQAMKEIEHIASLVTSIADQTNMLSLNASIEAARAGEHGKGFAVVADEVRKLATQTKQSVADVSRVLSDIHDHIVAMSQSLELASLSVTESTNGMETIYSFFDEFASALERICQYSVRIDDEMKACAEAVSEIHEAMEHVSASADELEGLASEL